MRSVLKAHFLKMSLNITIPNLPQGTYKLLPRFLNEKPRFTSDIFLVFIGMMLCFFTVTAEAATREYWIAAEKVEWNYAPSGQNLIRPNMGLDVWGKALVYEKYRYIQYTDDTYTTQVEQPVWMGILGPQLHAVEGDSIKVHFLNRADKPLSIHVHGLQYDEDNEGADMKGSGGLLNREVCSLTTGKSIAMPRLVRTTRRLLSGFTTPTSMLLQRFMTDLIGTVVVTKKGMERRTR